MKKGKLIVLEGLDGSGKTEVINRLKTDFPEFVYTREPGGSVFGEMIREVLLDRRSKTVPSLAILLGFFSARASHINEFILPAMKDGKTVITDRFDTSTFAFQIFGEQNKGLEKTFWFLRNKILKNIDIEYIYLRIKPEIAEDRRKKRKNNNHFDDQEREYHNRVFRGYENFFKKVKNYHQIDASLEKEEVYKQVVSCINKILKIKK